MPRTTFAPENKREDSSTFPKLSLEKDERARIVCIEQEPIFEWVHNLKAPQIVNNKPVYRPVEQRDGSVRQEMQFDFIGRPICLGEYGVIQDKGLDVDGCPVCAEAAKGNFVRPPERRFAFHVVRYATKPGGFEVQTPFQAQVLVWAFTEKMFSKLSDFTTEFGDMRLRDLMLGPCTNKMFQNFEVMPSNSAAWLANETNKKFVAELYKENQAKDLSVFCGRRADKSFILQDLETVMNRSRIAFPDNADLSVLSGVDVQDLLSQSGDIAMPTQDAAVIEDLNSLLDAAPPVIDVADHRPDPLVPTDPIEASVDLADLLTPAVAAGAAQSVSPESVAPTVPLTPEAPAAPAKVESLDDLLSSL